MDERERPGTTEPGDQGKPWDTGRNHGRAQQLPGCAPKAGPREGDGGRQRSIESRSFLHVHPNSSTWAKFKKYRIRASLAIPAPAPARPPKFLVLLTMGTIQTLRGCWSAALEGLGGAQVGSGGRGQGRGAAAVTGTGREGAGPRRDGAGRRALPFSVRLASSGRKIRFGSLG